jgi:hypothetical protein
MWTIRKEPRSRTYPQGLQFNVDARISSTHDPSAKTCTSVLSARVQRLEEEQAALLAHLEGDRFEF